MASMRAKEPSSRAPRVLLVDDDELGAEAYATYCTSEGLDTRTAANATDALQQLRDELADVVVLDVTMPGMNGIDLLNLLREDPETRHIPVIILSGTSRDLQSIHGAPWLRKPVPPPALLEQIRKMVR